MAFFLIGRGPEDDLRVLSESFFESRQDAMAELSRISADPQFSQWDTDVFVLDLEQGVPVLLVRPQSAELPMGAAEVVTPLAEAEAAEDSGAPDATEAEEAPDADEPVESAASIGVEEPGVAEETAPEASALPEDEGVQGGLRDAILRTTEHMSAEGIVPPASAGLGAADEVAELEPEVLSEDIEPEAQEAPEEGAEAATAEQEAGADNAWPWAATPPVPETDTETVSPDIATVYEALEASAEDASASAATDSESAEDDSDFILDLDAIQPVALDENPAQEEGDEESVAAEEIPEPAPAEPLGGDTYSSTLTDYTCEDCVYVETCPNRDQRAPKDCGSFQWK